MRLILRGPRRTVRAGLGARYLVRPPSSLTPTITAERAAHEWARRTVQVSRPVSAVSVDAKSGEVYRALGHGPRRGDSIGDKDVSARGGG